MAPRNGRCVRAALSLALFILAARVPGAAEDDPRKRAAEGLHQRGLERLAEGTVESRRQALRDFDEASRLDPRQPGIWLDFGRACIESGHRDRGRSCLRRAEKLAPRDADVQLALGLAWKRDWLSSLEESSLKSALRHLAMSASLDPDRAETWLTLSALELARGNALVAGRAALRAGAIDPAAGEPLLLVAGAAYRLGALGRADSTLRVAVTRLPRELSARFIDASWIAGEEPEIWSGLPTGESTRITSNRSGAPGGESGTRGSFWHGTDPDLTTPENEAELDYNARLALALLLFRDGARVRWDARTELFVRYGAPSSIEVNPLSSPLQYQYPRHKPVIYAADPLPYPYNAQIWNYPELGMKVELWDMSLTQSFQLPISEDQDLDPRPSPAVIAARPELIALGQGRGVFLTMPPGVRSMPASGHVSRFPTERGARLLVHLLAPGEPGDSLSAAWAVVAADGQVLERASRPLSPSACDPGDQRVADFALDVPPGEYRVDLAVSDPRGRRGLVRLGASVEPAPSRLTLSDLVLLCGAGATGSGADALRLEPNIERRVSGSSPLSLYFEIDHLEANNDGQARFAYRYSVHRVDDEDRARAKVAAFEASREETHDGARRRQFVTVPIRPLKRGAYDLVVEVKDLVAQTTANRSVRFVKD